MPWRLLHQVYPWEGLWVLGVQVQGAERDGEPRLIKLDKNKTKNPHTCTALGCMFSHMEVKVGLRPRKIQVCAT